MKRVVFKPQSGNLHEYCFKLLTLKIYLYFENLILDTICCCRLWTSYIQHNAATPVFLFSLFKDVSLLISLFWKLVVVEMMTVYLLILLQGSSISSDIKHFQNCAYTVKLLHRLDSQFLLTTCFSFHFFLSSSDIYKISVSLFLSLSSFLSPFLPFLTLNCFGWVFFFHVHVLYSYTKLTALLIVQKNGLLANTHSCIF